MISIQNKAQIENLLHSLSADKKPLWGAMKPQQMIEHLGLAIKASTMNKAVLKVPEEKALELKQGFIYGDLELPKNVKSSMYPTDELPPLRNASKEEAIEALLHTIDGFYAYFQEHQDRLTMNPVVGLLNMEEWEKFHNKHVVHHFKQFELI